MPHSGGRAGPREGDKAGYAAAGFWRWIKLARGEDWRRNILRIALCCGAVTPTTDDLHARWKGRRLFPRSTVQASSQFGYAGRTKDTDEYVLGDHEHPGVRNRALCGKRAVRVRAVFT